MKRTLAFILTLCLLPGLFPTAALAEEPEAFSEIAPFEEPIGESIKEEPVEEPEKEYVSVEPDYLCFTGTGEFTVEMGRSNANAPALSLEYSTDRKTWKPFTVGSTVAESGAGKVLYFRGSDSMVTGSSENGYNFFSLTPGEEGDTVAASGNLMTLLDYEHNPTLFTDVQKYAFACLFKGCTCLTSAPVLSATVLSPYCYLSLFEGCTALTVAPELPAMELAPSCYRSMFEGCTALKAAPVLAAPILEESCYNSMFKGCKKLLVKITTNWADTTWVFPAEAATGWNDCMIDGTASTLSGVATETMYSVTAHVHSFTYSLGSSSELFVEGEPDFIIGKCSGEGKCDAGEVSLMLSAQNKEYDGTAYGGVFFEDGGWTDAGLSLPTVEYYSGSKKLDSAPMDCGEYKAVISAGTGANAKSVSAEFSITPKALAVRGSTAEDKVFDNTTTASVTPGTVDGIIEGDEVEVKATGAFSDVNAGMGKEVAITYTLSGADKDNYSIEGSMSSADITKATNNAITSLKCEDIVKGLYPSVTVTSTYGTPELAYSRDQQSWGKWTEVCNGIGTYYVKATVQDCMNYNGAQQQGSFRLSSAHTNSIRTTPEAGTTKLVLGNKNAGIVTLSERDEGWTIETEGKYLQVVSVNNAAKVVKSDTPTVFEFDGGFKTTVTSEYRILWIFKKTVKTDYYLTFEQERGFALSTKRSTSRFENGDPDPEVIQHGHTNSFRSNNDGTHTLSCRECKEELGVQSCHFDEKGRCSECGALNLSRNDSTSSEITLVNNALTTVLDTAVKTAERRINILQTGTIAVRNAFNSLRRVITTG